jgi:hypothetical protein
LSVNTPLKFFLIKIINCAFKNNSQYGLDMYKNKLDVHKNNLDLYIKNLEMFNKLFLCDNYNYLSLVLFNSEKLSLNIQKGILKKTSRNMIQMTSFQRSIVIGIILSDGWIQYRKEWNPRIGFKQSIKNFEYFWYVFIQLSSLCSTYPWLTKTIKRGKLFYSLEFNTRQLRCITEIYTLFYSESRAKVIKPELYDYLDYLAIAHWIMGDGAKKNKGLTLCTDSFSYKEVVLLMNILKIKYDINTTIQKEKNKPRIYINNKELLKILPYIKHYFTPNFLYKIHL